MFEVPILYKYCTPMACITWTVIADDPFRNAMSDKSCFHFLDDSDTLAVLESLNLNEVAVIVDYGLWKLLPSHSNKSVPTICHG